LQPQRAGSLAYSLRYRHPEKEVDARALVETLRVYEMLSGMIPVEQYKPPVDNFGVDDIEGGGAEVVMTFPNRSRNFWPPLHYVFYIECARGAWPIARELQNFGADFGGLLMAQWARQYGFIQDSFNVEDRSEQSLFTPDLLEQWSHVYADRIRL